MHWLRAGVLASVAALGAAVPAASQDAGCSYQQCALRVQSRLFGDRVVRGVEATPVANLGSLFAPRIRPLESAGDSARNHYQRFRAYHARGGVLNVLGTIATIAGLVVWITDSGDFPFEEPGAATWILSGTGFALNFIGGIQVRLGREQLSQALWHYNGTLAPAR